MRNNFNGFLYKIKQFLKNIKVFVTPIFFWQMALTFLFFTYTNFIIFILISLFYLLILLLFI